MVQKIRVEELAGKLKSGEAVYLLDVRQPWEHALAALPGSVLIPLTELLARRDEIRPPAEALVVAYCHHGIRSRSAAAWLGQLGFHPVASLAGGIDAWSVVIDPNVARY